MKTNISKQQLLLLMSLSFAVASNAQTKPDTVGVTKKPASVEVQYNENDASGVSSINYREGEKRYKVQMKNDRITELYVDDRKIADKDFPLYQEAVNKIIEQVKKDKKKAEQNERLAMQDQQQATLAFEKAAARKLESEQHAMRAQQQQLQAEQDRQGKIESSQTAKLAKEQSLISKQQAEAYAQQSQKFKLVAEQNQKKAAVDMELATSEHARAQQSLERATVDAAKAEAERKKIDRLLGDIVSENIVNDRSKITAVDLTTTVFTVNGIQQPAAMQEKFSRKYLQEAGAKIQFSNRNGSVIKE